MATQQTMLACRACKRQTIHLLQKPNHVLHLLLSVFTLGLWLFLWLCVAAYNRPPQCTECGARYKPKPFRLASN